jgi:hypothetical protein
MGLGSEIRDPEKNLFLIPDLDPQHCFRGLGEDDS